MRKLVNLMLIALVMIASAACKETNTANDPKGQTNESTLSEKETMLEKAMKPYVENTVIATYSGMATEGLKLVSTCEGILGKVEAGTDYSAEMQAACDHWRAMRRYWEESEAFLFGPAGNHNIDPHIDSWPLDYNAMNALLSNEKTMAAIEEEGGSYVGNNLGYALKGFHACEYLLFEAGNTHACDLTRAKAIYLLGIAEDLTQQAILLEASWAGDEALSDEKAKFLEESEIETYGENYSEYFLNAGKAGSIYKTYQGAAEEIIAGCVDIATEVSSLKLGNPYKSSNKEEAEYIESPYSYTSIIDFQGNIRSIKNAYTGAKEGDASISDYIKTVDAELDANVREAIDNAIEEIGKIQNFETSAQGNQQVKTAMDAVAKIQKLLDNEVIEVLVK